MPVILTDAAQYYVHKFVDNLTVDKATKSKAVKFLTCLVTDNDLNSVRSKTLEAEKCIDRLTWNQIDEEWLQRMKYFAASELNNVQLSAKCQTSLATYLKTHVKRKIDQSLSEYVKILLVVAAYDM